MSRNLHAAVTCLGLSEPTTAIGRVLAELHNHWEGIDLVPARYVASRLSMLRPGVGAEAGHVFESSFHQSAAAIHQALVNPIADMATKPADSFAQTTTAASLRQLDEHLARHPRLTP